MKVEPIVELASGDNERDSFCVFVEVKIAPTVTGDILRQMQLYREYQNCWWSKCGPVFPLVVTAYSILASSVARSRRARQ